MASWREWFTATALGAGTAAAIYLGGAAYNGFGYQNVQRNYVSLRGAQISNDSQVNIEVQTPNKGMTSNTTPSYLENFQRDELVGDSMNVSKSRVDVKIHGKKFSLADLVQ
ncbi:MAG: hypothetical protein AABX47_06190 [Nanoarchaeota archaeon]